jgi:ABC-type multidrug transport system ATPase subunit
VVLDSVAPERVDYTLRFNYSTLPNTNWVVKWISRGLDTNYQRYFTSGFLTLQRSLDEWIFDRAEPPAAAAGPATSRQPRPPPPRWRASEAEARRLAAAANASGPPPPPPPSSSSSNSSLWLPPVYASPMPTADFSQNLFFAAVGFLVGLFMAMATLYPMSRLVKAIVEEKEARVKELQLMMGLRGSIFTLSWALTALASFSLTAALVTRVLTTSFIRFSSGSLVFLFVWLFFVSEIALAFLVSAFFSRAKLASIFAPVLLFASLLPKYIFFGTNRFENPAGKKLASLLSTSAFSFGADILADFEFADRGVTWDNLHDGAYSFADCLSFMCLDAFLYAGAAWYFSHVVQGQYGGSKPFWFPCAPSFWRATAAEAAAAWACVRGGYAGGAGGRSRSARGGAARAAQAGARARMQRDDELAMRAQDDAASRGVGGALAGNACVTEFVQEGSVGEVAVVLAKLRKVYGASGDNVACLDAAARGARALGEVVGASAKAPAAGAQYDDEDLAPDGIVAVGGLDLVMYTNQITCLLGHNGAGKTTTISMLTGLFPATGGDAWVTDAAGGVHSIRGDMPKIRRSLGVCPQHNVLYPRLTVHEHLMLFGALKNADGGLGDGAGSGGSTNGSGGHGTLAQRVGRMINAVGLGAKTNTEACALSGGMKRKLSVAVALIGSPRVVFLDEPTSGMDPYSRRAMWGLLRASKGGRAVVLTTHFMDEADLLGDRVGIMHGGELRTIGSPLFLKTRFGMGYTLSLVKNPRAGGGGSPGGAPRVAAAAPSAAGGGVEADEAAEEEEASRGIGEVIARHIGHLSQNRNARGDTESGGGAKLLSSSANELVYRLPLGSVSRFEGLFVELEQMRAQGTFGLGGFGIAMTTLEEVFLKLETTARADDEALKQRKKAAAAAGGGGGDGGAAAAEGGAGGGGGPSGQQQQQQQLPHFEEAYTADLPPPSGCTHFAELVRKRWKFARRDAKGFCFQIVLPVVLIAFVLLILTIDIKLAGRTLVMNSGLYWQPRFGYYSTQLLHVNASGRPDARGGHLLAHTDPTYVKLQSADAAPSAHLSGAVGHPRDSLDLSRYMLATWNDHDFDTRFAAFAFDDSIHWRLTNVSVAAGILLNQTNLTSPGSLTSAARVGAGLVGAVAYGESLGLVSLPAVTQSILRLLPASARYNATRLSLNVSLPAAQLTAVATPKELFDLLTLAANVSGIVDAVIEALEDAAGIARSRACVAFRQTNGCSGDGPRQQLPKPDPCPWLTSTVPADDTLGCADGTTCTGPRWWSCCNSRGGRAKCPRNLPVMCARANGCDQGQDHCCETECSAQGGLRGCPATRGDQTCDKVIPCTIGDCPSGFCECAGGVKVKRVSCVVGSRAPFTCKDACFAGLSPASLNETLGINAASIAAAAVRWERAFREAGYPLDDGSAVWPASLPTDVSFDGLRWMAGTSELELDHVRANVTLDMWPSRPAGAISLVVSLGHVRYREKLAPEEAQAAGVSPADNNRRFRMVNGVNITLHTRNASAFGGTGQTSLLRAAPFELAPDGSTQQQQLWDGAVLAVLGAAALAAAAASGVNGTGISGALSNAPDLLRWNASSPFTLLHNTSSPHALPAFLGETARAQYRVMTNRPAAVYDVRNHPLPLSVRQQATVEVVLSVIASLFILIPFCCKSSPAPLDAAINFRSRALPPHPGPRHPRRLRGLRRQGAHVQGQAPAIRERRHAAVLLGVRLRMGRGAVHGARGLRRRRLRDVRQRHLRHD